MGIVAYDYRFKSDRVDLKQLDEAISKALRKFVIIFATTEPCVYKIVNYLQDSGKISDYNTKTLDGIAIESYLDASTAVNHKYNQIKMRELLDQGILSDIEGKWIIIPNMSDRWSKKLAFFFYNELKSAGALGIIFYSEGPDNLGKVLIEETTLNILQFPAEVYQRGKVRDDAW